MNYQKVDKYMETYFTKFRGSSFVEKPKYLQSEHNPEYFFFYFIYRNEN